MWGVIDGSDVAEIIAGDTANNIMPAIMAGLGLIVGMLPRTARRPRETMTTDRPVGERRFESPESVRPLDRGTAGRR